MKKLTIIISVLVLVMCMSQCKKSDNLAAPEGGEGRFVTLTASIGDGSKTEILPDGLVQWSAGDKLYVVGSTQGYLGTLTTANYSKASASATFAGRINEITESQDIHFYYFGKTDVTLSGTEYYYSIATQDGTLDGIENTMHLMQGAAENVEAHSVNFGNVAMHNMMSVAQLDICGYETAAVCNAIASRTLNLTTGEWSSNGTAGDIALNNPSGKYYMALIPSDAVQTLTFRQNGSDANPIAISKTIEAGKLYTECGASIPVKLSKAFTVNADGLKVMFSPGNLQYIYNGGSPYFKFADNQWDYFGGTESHGQFTNSPYVDRDLFGWGTSRYDDKYPYMTTSSTSSYYSGDIAGTNYDWGQYNDIYNPSSKQTYAAGTWRTPTWAEWEYLLFTRCIKVNGVDQVPYMLCIVNDKKGLAVLPDNWDGSLFEGTSFENSYGNVTVGNCTFNESSDPTWSAMEAAGVVFLPAAGGRSGSPTTTTPSKVGIRGCYWSSTSSNTDKGRSIWFATDASSDQVKEVDQTIAFGLSVRLVKNVN